MSQSFIDKRETLSDEDRELLAYLRRKESTRPMRRFRVARCDPRPHYPLSFGQQRLWFLDQIEPGNPAYHFAFRLRFGARLNEEALRAALDELLRRHDVLRARFVVRDGELVQIIAPPTPLDLPFVDLSDVDEKVRENELKKLILRLNEDPFDLSAGALVRGLLIKQGADDHLLLMCLHHIVTDRWSMNVFARELGTLYVAFAAGKSSPLEALPVQYTDYAVWERESARGSSYEASLAYWRAHLADLTTLALPTDRLRPPIRDFGSGQVTHPLANEIADRLRGLAKDRGVTLFTVYLAGFAVLLQRLSGQSDLAIGSPVSNRDLPELEGLIGYFLNTLVLRLELPGNWSVNELLSRVRDVLLDAYRHQEVPFETLVEELAPKRDLSRSPLFQVLFVHLGETSVSAMGETASVSGMPALSQPDKVSADYDLEVYVTDTPRESFLGFHFRTDIFDRATIERVMAYYVAVLWAMGSNPEYLIGEIPLLGAKAQAKVIETGWGPRTALPARCVHRLIEDVARCLPDAIAVEAEEGSLNFRELNRRSNQLARRLRELRVGPGVLVGVCMDRTVDLLVGVLAVMKSGGAYVPLDAEFPRDRLAFMVDDARLDVVVTRGGLAQDVLPETRAVMVDLDVERISLDSLDCVDLDGGASLDDLAYVIYTSGSTGRPKGVCVEHRALTNFVTAAAEVLGVGSRDRLLGVASLSFDASVLDLYVPLARGACVILAARTTSADGRRLAQLIEDSSASLMHATPATWQLLRLSGWRGRKDLRALSGGEALPRPLADWLAGACHSVVNLYGPTETTVYVAAGEPAQTSGDGVVGIGRPLPNSSIHVLDDALRPVPPGVVGEICIGGVQVARGYLNRDELTMRRFVSDPSVVDAGSRLYRTGDLGRYCVDGGIEFLGRADHQVKMRGHRIELGEIESVLAEDPAVAQTVVLCREDVPGDQRLVGYVVPSGAATVDVDAFRARLRSKLPAYMVPSALVVLEALPLTPSRKVNRAALPAPLDERGEALALAEAENEAERLLVELWRDALGTTRIGAYDNFFDLGGHSLLVVRVIEQMRERTGIAIPPREYMMQNLRQIATLYERPQTLDDASAGDRRSGRFRRDHGAKAGIGG